MAIPTVEQIKGDAFRNGALTNCDARSGYRIAIKESLRIMQNDKISDEEKVERIKAKLSLEELKEPCRQ